MEEFGDEIAALADRAKNAPAGSVVFYGSSSIRLWETLADDFQGVPTLNLGFGGSTLAQCAEPEVFESLVVAARPRSLVFYAGDNDIADGATPEAVLQSFRHLADQVTARLGKIPQAYIAIKPSPARFALVERIRAANAFIECEIRERDLGHFVDIYPLMLDEEGTPRREFFADDCLHLSAAGYAVWAQMLCRLRDVIA